jgi:hypothetical protein
MLMREIFCRLCRVDDLNLGPHALHLQLDATRRHTCNRTRLIPHPLLLAD